MSRMVLDYGRGVWRVAPASAATRADALDCEVSRASVDGQLVEAVERTVRLAARSLDIDPPRVRWLPTGTSGIRGVTFSENLREIWVTVQSKDNAQNTALHELRHCWQLDADRWIALDLLTMDARQRDADRFARDWQPPVEMKGDRGERLVQKTATLPLELKADTVGEFVGYVATWDVDQIGERFTPGSFKASLQKRSHRPLLWAHDTTRPIGVEIAIGEDSKGVRGVWRFADTAEGRDMRALVRSGSITSMSVGFLPVQTREASGGIVEITEADLVESSLVSLPCNVAATVQSVKSVPMPAKLDFRAELARRRARRYRG